MKLILHHTYSRCAGMSPTDAFSSLAESGAAAIVCRIRRSADRVLLVHHDTTMARLCLCEERVDALRFAEIDALLHLEGIRPLTLEQLLTEYAGETPIVFHFRSFRPDARTVSRIFADKRYRFATDSVEQMRLLAEAYDPGRMVGFASHIPNAEAMLDAGASTVCLHGRGMSGYSLSDIRRLSEKGEVWAEIAPPPEDPVEPEIKRAEKLALSGIVLGVEDIR